MIRLALAVATCTLLVACGGGGDSNDAGNPGSDSGTPGSDAGTPGSDAGTPDAGSDAGSGAADSGTGGGIGFLTGTPAGAEFPSPLQFSGDFAVITVISDGTYHCTTPVNGCKYCPPLGADAGQGQVDFQFVGAGTITLDDGSTTLATIPYNPDAGVYEVDGDQNAALTWSPGDTLKASASGGQVPAFSASITAPHPLTGVTPALNLLTPINVSTSSNFTISWTPTSDNATMELILGSSNGTNSTISCTGPESAGSITLDSSVFSIYSGGSGTIQLKKTVSAMVPSSIPFTINAQAVPAQGQINYTP